MEEIISKSQVEQICSFIKCGDTNGSGFYIKEDIILTARHNIVDSINSGTILTVDNKKYESTAIIAENAAIDMCLIKVEIKKQPYLPLIITQLFFRQDCSFYGFPNYSDELGEHLEGKINILPKDKPYDIRIKIEGADDYDYSGLSGAPVYSEGKLIGMVRLQIDDEIGVVSFAKAKEFLELNGIVLTEDSKTKSLPKQLDEIVVSSVTNYKTTKRLNRVLLTNQKWLLCSGSPGSGKTTFAVNFQPDSEEILICGKYFIKIPNDKEAIEVRTSIRSILSWLEISISKALSENIELLDKLEDRIKRVETLLSELSISGISKKYLFIIDGLDEVRNIDSFLGIFPINIPQNIQIILFCTNKDILPSRIKSELVNKNEIRLEPLELSDCENYIQGKLQIKNVTFEMIQKLAMKSEGHPLYLNYLINYLNSIKIDDDKIEEWIVNNPSIEGDIENYYDSIWDSFFRSSEKLWLISTISQFRNLINEKLLINCIPPDHKLTFYSEIAQIRYLTTEGDFFEIYHRSFKNFITKKVPEILPIINDNIFNYYDLNKDEIYSIENWLFHKQNGTKSEDSVKDCNQEWADNSCLNHINPELIIEDIKNSLAKAVDFRFTPEVIRILLLLQRIEFRYDSLFAENSFELCKSLISMGEFSASLRYLVREGDLLVSDNDALLFLQHYYENDAIFEGNQLLDVLESRFRLFLEKEFKTAKTFSLTPFLLMISAYALSMKHNRKGAIDNCMGLLQNLKRFQDAAQKDGAIEAADAFLKVRELGSARVNAYALRCFDYYVSPNDIVKISKVALDKTWTRIISLNVIFYRDFDGYDTVNFEESENYHKYIKDIEWLIDNYGLEEDNYSKQLIIKALINDSTRTDIIETLIKKVQESEEEKIGLIKSKNGVDVNFKKLISDEFMFLCEGFAQKENSFNILVSQHKRNSDWESYLFSLLKEIHFLEGKILRIKNHSCDFTIEDCENHLKIIISSIDFNLSERANWDRSYLIPEDVLPLLFSKITSLYLIHFPDELKWYVEYIKARCEHQFGLYNEGYRATLMKIIEKFIQLNIEKNETILLIDILSNFVLQNIENRWERTPELLLINEFYNLIGEREKAELLYEEIMKTSMGPSWYKESQFSILNTAFLLSPDACNLNSNGGKVAYLLNEASGEMTFQRYVRHSKERFIGLLAEKKCFDKAIELLKFETIPPINSLIQNAEFYDFDQIRLGSGYSYGANNIDIESGVLELIEKCETKKPELKIALAYIFALHNEIFRHISDFGKSIGLNLNLIDKVTKKEVIFSWIIEIANSSNIKGEKRNFLSTINNELSNSLIEDFNVYAKKNKVDFDFKLIDIDPASKVDKKTKKTLDAFEEFNEKYQKNIFESKSQLLKEASLAFSKERISIWMSNWSTSSKITRKIIKENLENSSELLKTFDHFLKNVDEESWDIANDLIWFGDALFSEEEIERIQNNIYEHIELLVYRKKTMKKRYDWFLEDKLTSNCDDGLFKLLIWLMDYPDEDINNRATNAVIQLINLNSDEFLLTTLKEANNNSNSNNLRIKLFRIILEFSKLNPIDMNNIISINDFFIKMLIGNLDLLSSKFLKDIADVLNGFGFKEFTNQVTKRFNIDNKESKDAFFEDDRFECVKFKIESLIENQLLSSTVCKNLEATKEIDFSYQYIELLKKSNQYLRQSFRESRILPDNYRNAAIKCLNEAIMPIINIKNMDKAFKIINR